MRKLLSRIFGHEANTTRRSVQKMVPTNLNLEGLEERCNPSSFVSSKGELFINATSGSDTVTVSNVTKFGVNYVRVTENGYSTDYIAFSIKEQYTGTAIYFNGYAGNDFFRNDTALTSTAYGYGGNDTLIGGSNSDTLNGGEDNDTVLGRGGSDTLYAGADYWYNTNYLYGGDDPLYGTNDVLYGGFGTDYMYGEGGTDWLYGGYGNDFLYGGDNHDYLYGEVGNDTLDGGDDGWIDVLSGGAGYDRFQQELVWNGSSYGNRDQPVDFSSAYDSYYNNAYYYSTFNATFNG